LLKRGEIRDALVFTRTKHRADRLARALAQEGIKVERIHGNRSQSQRTEALAGFKSGKYLVLVATDIAARGIDVAALGHVVNFDVPPVAEDYIHRVGRTARAELTGSAFTLVSPEEEGRVREIERGIGRGLPRVTVADFDYQKRPVVEARDSGRSGRPTRGGTFRPLPGASGRPMPEGSGRPMQGGSGRPMQGESGRPAPGGRPFRSFSRSSPVRRRTR
jgi:superfamily II DNA/RNA helicase